MTAFHWFAPSCFSQIARTTRQPEAGPENPPIAVTSGRLLCPSSRSTGDKHGPHSPSAHLARGTLHRRHPALVRAVQTDRESWLGLVVYRAVGLAVHFRLREAIPAVCRQHGNRRVGIGGHSVHADVGRGPRSG